MEAIHVCADVACPCGHEGGRGTGGREGAGPRGCISTSARTLLGPHSSRLHGRRGASTWTHRFIPEITL
jgi:hypothetical protein